MEGYRFSIERKRERGSNLKRRGSLLGALESRLLESA
jgi:hypothetical protein